MIEFSEISWLVTEPEYRADSAYSASQIGSYQKEGLVEVKKDSPSLLAGSVLDTMCTDFDNFDNYFEVADVNVPTTVTKPVADELIAFAIANNQTMAEIPDEVIYTIAHKNDFGAANWKTKTVIAKIKESIGDYVDVMVRCAHFGKRVITPKMYMDAYECKNILCERYPDIFGDTSLEEHERVYYQLKFRVGLKYKDEIFYLRSMLDVIKVDYKNKIIYPVDLKTKWSNEEKFIDSFFEWRYVYQSGIYKKVLSEAIKGTFFEDFTIAPFKFIVISNITRRPFCFVVDDTVPFNNKEYVYKSEVIPSWEDVLYDMHITKTNGNIYKLCENEGLMTINLKNYEVQ